MPKGVEVEIDDGFATIEFTDPSLRGVALSKLLDVGGPETIETLTRGGARTRYRVPEGNAREAGLIDTETAAKTSTTPVKKAAAKAAPKKGTKP